jgi:hypothetical protein
MLSDRLVEDIELSPSADMPTEGVDRGTMREGQVLEFVLDLWEHAIRVARPRVVSNNQSSAQLPPDDRRRT